MAGAVVVGGGGRVVVGGGGGGGGGAVGGGISRDMVGGCGAVGGGGGRDVVGIPAGAGGSGSKGVMVGGKGWVAIFVLAITSPSSCFTLIESLLTVYFFGKKQQQNLVIRNACSETIDSYSSCYTIFNFSVRWPLSSLKVLSGGADGRGSVGVFDTLSPILCSYNSVSL